MKKSKLPYLIFFLVNIGVALSCFFYPVSRDEFYYLEKPTQNLFAEYRNSYFFGNPRIGQFVANFISRNLFAEVLFGLLLFNGLVAVLFLNIYRRIPNIKVSNDLRKFLVIAAIFILLLSYFGEMFYYTPFSTNYTLTHFFYLIFVFLFTEYYVYGKHDRLDKIPYFLLAIFGVFIGMGNEHIPPVLLLMSFLGGMYFLFKNKKLPNLRFIVLPISIFVGYAVLFFAPANSIKEKTVGKSVFGNGIDSYFSNFGEILKLFYYFNIELLIAAVSGFVVFIIFKNKLFLKPHFKTEILVYVLLAIFPLFIVAISPLIGTRLLFFSTVLIIIILFKVGLLLQEYFEFKHFGFLPTAFLLAFFTMSILVTSNANQTYKMTMVEIKNQKLHTDDVALKHKLNYFYEGIGKSLNRKILLESGETYIDENPLKNTAVEQNLINFFKLKSLKSE